MTKAGRTTADPRLARPDLESLEDRLLLSVVLPANGHVDPSAAELYLAEEAAAAPTDAGAVRPSLTLEREMQGNTDLSEYASKESLRHIDRADDPMKESVAYEARLAILDALHAAYAVTPHAASGKGSESFVNVVSSARPVPAIEAVRSQESPSPAAAERPAAVVFAGVSLVRTPLPAMEPPETTETAPAPVRVAEVRQDEVPVSDGAETPRTPERPWSLTMLRDALPLQETPPDLAALRRDMDAVFVRLDHLSHLDAGLSTASHVLAWVAVAAAGLEIVRRRARRGALAAPPGDVLIDSVFSLPETE